jgi:hypothetical protein
MRGFLSEVATASGKLFERFEELEHAGKGCPVANGIGTIGGDPAFDPVVRGPVDFKQ